MEFWENQLEGSYKTLQNGLLKVLIYCNINLNHFSSKNLNLGPPTPEGLLT